MLGRGQQTTSGVRPPVFSLTTAVPSRQRSQMASPSVRLCLVLIQVKFTRSSQLSGCSWINDHVSFIAKHLAEEHKMYQKALATWAHTTFGSNPESLKLPHFNGVNLLSCEVF